LTQSTQFSGSLHYESCKANKASNSGCWIHISGQPSMGSDEEMGVKILY
jgi:hypothetical protein